MGWYRKVLVSSIAESVIFSAIAAGVAFAGEVGLQVQFFDGFGFVLLILSAALMLVGGAMSFVTPGTAKVVSLLTGRKENTTIQDWERSQHRAALYMITGVILFAESMVLAGLTLASV